MKAQEWIRVLTDSSNFYTITVHIPKPPHRTFLSYQDIGLHSWGEYQITRITKKFQGAPWSTMQLNEWP